MNSIALGVRLRGIIPNEREPDLLALLTSLAVVNDQATLDSRVESAIVFFVRHVEAGTAIPASTFLSTTEFQIIKFLAANASYSVTIRGITMAVHRIAFNELVSTFEGIPVTFQLYRT